MPSAIVDKILQQWKPTLFPLVWHWAAAEFPTCNSLQKWSNNWRKMQPTCMCFLCLIESNTGCGSVSVTGWGLLSGVLSKRLWNKMNIFSCSFILFLKKLILSTWFLIESHCLISYVWSDLFLCFSLNEITTNSLFKTSRQRPAVESHEVSFFESLLKSSDLAEIFQYRVIVSATSF